jgi:hypothetical protein
MPSFIPIYNLKLSRKFMDALESSTKGTKFEGQIQSLFRGLLSTSIECTNVKVSTQVKEEFYGITSLLVIFREQRVNLTNC